MKTSQNLKKDMSKTLHERDEPEVVRRTAPRVDLQARCLKVKSLVRNAMGALRAEMKAQRDKDAEHIRCLEKANQYMRSKIFLNEHVLQVVLREHETLMLAGPVPMPDKELIEERQELEERVRAMDLPRIQFTRSQTEKVINILRDVAEERDFFS